MSGGCGKEHGAESGYDKVSPGECVEKEHSKWQLRQITKGCLSSLGFILQVIKS